MPGPLTLRDRLRIETRAAHDALDASLDLAARPPGRDEYARLLRRFQGFHQAVEPCLARYLKPALMAGRSKLGALQHDLDRCGVAAGTYADHPPVPDLPAIADRAGALGLFYVSEGSTLGGRLIARLTRDNPAIPADACTYFDIYGSRTQEMWRAACEALARLEDEADIATAVATANRIFWILQGWLDPSHWRQD